MVCDSSFPYQILVHTVIFFTGKRYCFYEAHFLGILYRVILLSNVKLYTLFILIARFPSISYFKIDNVLEFIS